MDQYVGFGMGPRPEQVDVHRLVAARIIGEVMHAEVTASSITKVAVRTGKPSIAAPTAAPDVAPMPPILPIKRE